MTDDFQTKLIRVFPRGLEGARETAPAARFASPAETVSPGWIYETGKIFLGTYGGKWIGRGDDRHVVTIAGSRAGKGVSLIIPNLGLYPGSVLAIDPKGELARITKRGREQRLGQKCFVLDPFNANKRHPSASFNPLAEIDPASPEAVDDAALVADALIIAEEKGNNHWTDSAKVLLKGLILLTLLMPPEERNLVTVRKLLTLMHPSLDDIRKDADNKDGKLTEMLLFDRMKKKETAFDGVLAAIGEQFLATPDNERGSILSTARVQTEFLDSPTLRQILTRSDFKLADLKRQAVTVYLCLPAGRMATHYRWLRIVINLALISFERIEQKPKHSVLLLLEEFNVLGYMKTIEVAAGQLAGFGVKIWTILQDISQLQHHYKATWETFLGNAGLVTAFANADTSTLEMLSKRLGTRSITIETPSKAGMQAQLGGASPLNERAETPPLASPAELERGLARDQWILLVLYSGVKLLLERVHYEKLTLTQGMFDPP